MVSSFRGMGFQFQRNEWVFSFREMGFQFQRNEWVFSLRGMGFLTIFKLDVGEEHEDEDNMGCWGRT